MIDIDLCSSPAEGHAAIIVNPNVEYFSSRVICFLLADFLRFTADVSVSIRTIYPVSQLPYNLVNYDSHTVVVPESLLESVEYVLDSMSSMGLQEIPLSGYLMASGNVPGLLEQCVLGEATRFVALHLDEFPDDIERLGRLPATGDEQFLENIGAWQLNLMREHTVNTVLRAIEHDGENYTRAEKIPIADFMSMYYLLREGDSCLTHFPQPPTGA